METTIVSIRKFCRVDEFAKNRSMRRRLSQGDQERFVEGRSESICGNELLTTQGSHSFKKVLFMETSTKFPIDYQKIDVISCKNVFEWKLLLFP